MQGAAKSRCQKDCSTRWQSKRRRGGSGVGAELRPKRKNAPAFKPERFMRKHAKLRRFRAFVRVMRPDFSVLQTVWRRGRDSNPRYRFAMLSLDVSVSCRLQNTAREFHAKT